MKREFCRSEYQVRPRKPTECPLLWSLALTATLSIFLLLPSAIGSEVNWYARAEYPNGDRYGVAGYNYVYNNYVISGYGISEALAVYFYDYDWFAIGWNKDQAGGSAHFYADWCFNNLPPPYLCMDYHYVDLGIATYGTSHSYKVSTSSITSKTYKAFLDSVAKAQATFGYSYSKPAAASEAHDPRDSLTGHYWNLMHQIYIPQTGLQ